MRDTWSRAYFTVAILGIVLVPSAAYVAATATDTIAYVAKQIGVELPDLTECYIGTLGFVAVGGTGLAVIGLMALWRHAAWAVIVSAFTLVICLYVFLLAVLALHIPFRSILWKLS
jgi:hypothetical protein